MSMKQFAQDFIGYIGEEEPETKKSRKRRREYDDEARPRRNKKKATRHPRHNRDYEDYEDEEYVDSRDDRTSDEPDVTTTDADLDEAIKAAENASWNDLDKDELDESKPKKVPAAPAPAPEPTTESTPAPVKEQATVNKVVVGTSKIQDQPKDKEVIEMLDFVDLTSKYEGKKLPIAVAQLMVTGTLNPQLAEIIDYAILHNAETRQFIADNITDIIREHPEVLKKVQGTVYEMARDYRVKYMYFCPCDKGLYDNPEIALENQSKADLVQYAKGNWKFISAWVRTDADGKIVKGETLSEDEVRDIISGLPKAVQAEAYKELHLEPPKKSNKPSGGKSEQKPAKKAEGDTD